MRMMYCVFSFKQKTAYEMRISDWSSDLCSSELLRQANLFGPASFVSADDGEVIEFSQAGFAQTGGQGETICELDGRGIAPTPHMVTETLIRGMYGYWRKVMEI